MTTHRKTTRRKKNQQLTEWTAYREDKSWIRQLVDTTTHRYSSKVKKNPIFLLTLTLTLKII